MLALSLGSAFQPRALLPRRLTSIASTRLDRRGLMKEVSTAAAAASAAVLWPRSAIAQPKEFSGVDTQAPPPDGEAPFETLPSGVKVKVMRSGQGETVSAGKTVSVQINGRLLNLNGVSFYNTK